jgi:hypothetical protein
VPFSAFSPPTLLCPATSLAFRRCVADHFGVLRRLALPTMLLLCGCSSQPSHESAYQAALKDLAAIQRGDCASVESGLTSDMRARLSDQEMCSDYRAYLIKFGDFMSHGSPKLTTIGTDEVVQVPLRMKKQDGEFRITFNALGHVAGLYFLRTGVPL